MARADAYILKKHLFGEQFELLSGALVDADPVERAKALSLLDGYLHDCMKPMAELRRQIGFAIRNADRANRLTAQSQEVTAESPSRSRTRKAQELCPACAAKAKSAKEQEACLMALISEP